MKILPLFFLLSGILQAEPRGTGAGATDTVGVWSDIQGRTLRGRLVRASGTLIRLELADGSQRGIPLEKFAVADQRRILRWMVGDPAALEYAFAITTRRQEDGAWQVVVTNLGANTLADLKVQGQFVGAAVQPMGEQGLPRLEPGRAELLVVSPPVPTPGVAGLRLRLCRQNAVIWESSPAGYPQEDWALGAGQVRVPPTGLSPALALPSLMPAGAGSGRLGLSPGGAPDRLPVGDPEGEDLVKLFEMP